MEYELKYLEYGGLHPPHRRGEVAYMVVDTMVIFSGLEGSAGRTSTINAAEEIVSLICAAESIDWREYEFFDLQTWMGYPNHTTGYYCLERLILSREQIRVESWLPVVSSTQTGQETWHQELAGRVLKHLTP